MTVQHEGQLAGRLFELRKAFRRRTVEHDADHDQGAAVDAPGIDNRTDGTDVSVLEKPLRAPVAGGGADADLFGEIGVRQPSVPLQQAQDIHVDPV